MLLIIGHDLLRTATSMQNLLFHHCIAMQPCVCCLLEGSSIGAEFRSMVNSIYYKALLERRQEEDFTATCWSFNDCNR